MSARNNTVLDKKKRELHAEKKPQTPNVTNQRLHSVFLLPPLA